MMNTLRGRVEWMMRPLRCSSSWLLLAAVLAAMLPPQVVSAQDSVLEALVQHRQLIRTAEVIDAIGPRAEIYGPAELAIEARPYARLRPQMPTLRMPEPPRPPLVTRPAPEAAVVERPPLDLSEIHWARIAADREEAFMVRFVETLWTRVGGAVTAIDTMATPEVRARLNGVFGAPTRSPVARSRPQMQAGSEFVQFEYWFVVNDSIPFVVMDRNGPFGRGVLIISSEEHAGVHDALKQDLAARLTSHDRLMPYVDYFHSEERRQWYLARFDGERYFVEETDRPRWARRGQARGHWYDFR